MTKPRERTKPDKGLRLLSVFGTCRLVMLLHLTCNCHENYGEAMEQILQLVEGCTEFRRFRVRLFRLKDSSCAGTCKVKSDAGQYVIETLYDRTAVDHNGKAKKTHSCVVR